MRNNLSFAMIAVCLAAVSGVAGAQATTLPLQIDISMTLTADKTYALGGQTFVNPGATLTIEAGTVIASDPAAQGSLAVTRGAQIMVLGNSKAPVIFTSTNDVATWTPDPTHPTGGDPTTGTWREAANEWGNLTIMGNGYISENGVTGNTQTCDPNNVANMEGLVPNPMFPGRTQYGGGDDDDDSGTIRYMSLRYGGRVTGLANELNGLSLGGIGRDTDISHFEIMNNVDDGVEIWGGTVELKFASIWNIGDDSVDIDQGWRGKAQFILIVQGYSLDASQGSGVGDNCFELDGAEDSNFQPVTTAVIKNATVIGQPLDGDHAMAFRDNARVQFHNCIYRDIGDDVVRFDNVDGDGANGYGFSGTLSWPATWTTPFNAVPAHPNDCGPGIYTAQTQGNLIEVTDSLFESNNDYTEATARGVFGAGNNNTMEPGDCPFKAFGRAAPVLKGTTVLQQLTTLDPRLDTTSTAGADAASPVNFSNGQDDFFSYADYKGAFNATDNWLAGWTASSAFGFTPDGTATDFISPALPVGQAASDGALLEISSSLNSAGDAVADLTAGPHKVTLAGGTMDIDISGEANQPIVLLANTVLNVGAFDFNPFLPGAGQLDLDLTGIAVIGNGAEPGILNAFFRTDSNGQFGLDIPAAAVAPGVTVYFQCWISNTTTFIRVSNAVSVEFI